MAQSNGKNRPAVTKAEVEEMVAKYEGLRAKLDTETGPTATIVNCGTENDEGIACGKPIAFVVNLSALRDGGLKDGQFPQRPVDAIPTLSGNLVVNRNAFHQCLAKPFQPERG